MLRRIPPIIILAALAVLVACPAPDLGPTRPTETATICLDTGLLANKYCPHMAVRRYYVAPKPGEPVKPTLVCSVHQAPAPPVEKYDGALPRFGMDWYEMTSFSKPQILAYVNLLVHNGGGFTRIFLCHTWGAPPFEGWKDMPYRQIGWTLPEDGGTWPGAQWPVFTIFEGDKYGAPWNEVVLDKLRYLAALCRERNVVLDVSVVDGLNYGTSDAGRYEVRHHPWIMNAQHLGAESAADTGEFILLDGTHDFGLRQHTGGMLGGFGADVGGLQKTYMAAYFKKIAAELIASGVEYLVSTNEVSRLQEAWETPEQNDATFVEFLKWFCLSMTEAGVPNSRIVISAAGAHSATRIYPPVLAAYPGIMIEWHGPNSWPAYEKMWNAGVSTGWPIVLDGDGYDSGAAGYYNGFFWMPSVDDANQIRAGILALNASLPDGRKIARYATFNGFGERKDPLLESIDAALAGSTDARIDPWAVLRALSGHNK